MYGAIIGDVNGSKYEFNNIKTKNFKLFQKDMVPTDDSYMTIAIAIALMESKADFSDLSEKAVYWMRRIGNSYPDGKYGGAFKRWLRSPNPEPYYSWGNGSAMRVSAVGWVANSLEEVYKLSEAVTKVSHNHPEGILGAECTAACIYLARKGCGKDEIRQFVNDNYYNISDLRVKNFKKHFFFDESCQGTVPYAVEIFLESKDFDDCIKLAISVGGDSDTIAAIAGSIAEAYYGIDSEEKKMAKKYLPSELAQAMEIFEEFLISRATGLQRVVDVRMDNLIKNKKESLSDGLWWFYNEDKEN